MKKLLLSVAVGWVFLASAFCQGFYDINTINTIEIVFEQQNWNYLLDSLYSAGEGRLAGTAFVNGQQFDSVGVRYKGNSSYQPGMVKKPLNIKLDYIFPGQELDGFGTLKLSNGFKDPSFVREALGYEIARTYIPASGTNYAKVFINGTCLGLYTSVQDVDKYFMQTHFGSRDRAFFKGEMNGGPANAGCWQYFGPDSSQYYDHYTIESDHGWAELVNFLDTLNNNNMYLKKVLNIDRHLWMLAYDILLVNLDAPVNMPQNYYLYRDASGCFNPVPWDLNETFGGFINVVGGPPLNHYQLQHLSPYFNASSSSYPILSKVLDKPVHKRMYVAHMKTMIGDWFSNSWYIDRALEIQSVIDEEIQNDPNTFYTYQDFLDNIYTTCGGGPPPAGPPVIGIQQLMQTRVDYLTSLAEFQAEAPEISDVTCSPSIVTPGDEVWITAAVTGAVAVQLGFRSSDAIAFTKTNMYDDGNHHDGEAGDGVYGASAGTAFSDISYYIFADNDEAVSFLPERAEYEYFTVPVTPDVAINEFMADNETAVADQDGEYDDWIELYNNSGTEISLTGYYLSDDVANPGKWAFPDTAIAANGYLVVWADEDGSQEGLHANFRLAAAGEVILFSGPALTLLDEVSFGPQKADTTTGRYPNGTGDFIEMLPTFGTENTNLLTGMQELSGELPIQPVLNQNYPNPFSDGTSITFSLPFRSDVCLEVYDFCGRKIETIINERLDKGEYNESFENKGYPAGIYFLSLSTEQTRQVVRMALK